MLGWDGVCLAPRSQSCQVFVKLRTTGFWTPLVKSDIHEHTAEDGMPDSKIPDNRDPSQRLRFSDAFRRSGMYRHGVDCGAPRIRELYEKLLPFERQAAAEYLLSYLPTPDTDHIDLEIYLQFKLWTSPRKSWPGADLLRDYRAAGRRDDGARLVKPVTAHKLPYWADDKRGTPNVLLRSSLFSAIQNRDRQVYLTETPIGSSGDISILVKGPQLNQEDLTVWETCVHLARKHPLGTICVFTRFEMLEAMELNTGGKEYARLDQNIRRLAETQVDINFAGMHYFGTLIQGKQELDTLRYTLRLNPDLIAFYSPNSWTGIDWGQRHKLRGKPLALALHGYFSSHTEPVPVFLETLRKFVGSRIRSAYAFKQKAQEAMGDLVDVGLFTSFHIAEDNKVYVHRTSQIHLSGSEVWD
jgi:hypothetical protein